MSCGAGRSPCFAPALVRGVPTTDSGGNLVDFVCRAIFLQSLAKARAHPCQGNVTVHRLAIRHRITRTVGCMRHHRLHAPQQRACTRLNHAARPCTTKELDVRKAVSSYQRFRSVSLVGLTRMRSQISRVIFLAGSLTSRKHSRRNI